MPSSVACYKHLNTCLIMLDKKGTDTALAGFYFICISNIESIKYWIDSKVSHCPIFFST
uniref:Uncharacterized protein n=1 Tax=Physcomitrium patens TaxID=3218 RepID=A0A2K1KQN1_PHYPA|nr:hypothetical protein PHYPA_006974 [Physcomitrium patens]